jgi:hypothetical protein
MVKTGVGWVPHFRVNSRISRRHFSIIDGYALQKFSDLFLEVDMDFYLDPSADMNLPVIKFKHTTTDTYKGYAY